MFERTYEVENTDAVSDGTSRSRNADDVPGAYGPNYCPMPRSLEEAEAQYSRTNPTTVSEARALEAERPLTAEEARKSGG